ncbi:MAG: hypothetical protein WDN46_19105 [Methylocella sp.]
MEEDDDFTPPIDGGSQAHNASLRAEGVQIPAGYIGVLEAVDGRSKEARRFRSVVAEIIADLGGPDGLSEGQRQLAKRAGMISLYCEAIEAAAVAGRPFEADRYAVLCNVLTRLFGRLGLQRVAREVKPMTILDYRRMQAEADNNEGDK